MSLLKEPSITDLDQTSDQIKNLMRNRPDLEEQLRPLRQHLIEMRVALSELDELREENIRGNITEDTYHVRRKKLKTDYMLARDSISDHIISGLLDEVKNQNDRSRLQKLKDAISSNKEYILLILNIASTLLKTALGTA